MDGLPKYRNNYNENVVSKPINQPKVKTNSQSRAKKIKLAKPKWNAMDFVMVGAVVVTIIAAAFLVIFTANKSTTANTQLAATSAQLEQVRNKNNTLKQQVSDLSSPKRLNSIAEKNGLTLKNQNIRNVK
ncbi:cell division protein FtsL [Weissella sagaensis]|jgi:cell division protein FtsL|uniref:Cell division protein FtsL n=1 Tax=Weissella sagaensis TaxID=2559928 RepID=A0ABW1RT14_9LACO|nr:cell division protein FtsL [Weissella sagaensis]KAA8433046.1 cell division protein FtsL [Weissella paramesenteroides]MBU7568292.1 cell division protein FtsL [Weissella hellenica]KAA8437990.1 cell division protein FtsL [Weissella paramesenteroides]QDJ59172.1 cell division protein FtsL [Weissella hellenica]QEA56464.1 cell division protein FtsL [Weissella hellenica]